MIRSDRIIPFPADRLKRSPNHGKRAYGQIDAIVLHATADGGHEFGAENWMANPKSQVSAHLHIRRDGSVTRHVSDDRAAWHAGKSEWAGRTGLNEWSLGWEIANRNDGKEPYTDAQYRTVAKLLWFYLPQGIDRAGVLTHAQIAPGRKTDPKGWDFTRMWRELGRLTPEARMVEIAPRLPGPDLGKVD